MKLAKKQRRQLYNSISAARQGLAARSPRWARSLFGPIYDTVDMLFVDHGIFRVIYPNRHRLGAQAWRAAQPTPGHVAAMARRGVKTIINLRGVRDCGSYRLARAACQRHGVALVDFQLKSRAAPDPATMRAARAVLEDVEYPIMFHCKSGADRAGLMAVLYALYREGQPIDQALEQLDWKFGHFRAADTGILDQFFEDFSRHRAAARAAGTPAIASDADAFIAWLETDYDADALKEGFQAKGVTNWFVNTVLRRE